MPRFARKLTAREIESNKKAATTVDLLPQTSAMLDAAMLTKLLGVAQEPAYT